MSRKKGNFRMNLYHKLVNSNPVIRKKYHNLRSEKSGASGRIYAWMALLLWNVEITVFPGRYIREEESPDADKRIEAKYSESSMAAKENPERLAEKLSQYDIISFDLFDTLLFRIFSKPTDLFYLVGEELEYPDFTSLRIKAEETVRRQKQMRKATSEITLSEIYHYLERFTGINAEEGMKAEITAEKKSCFGNPYMLEVFRELKKKGKTFIAVSDMYLPKDVIREIVERSGFTGISRFFISGELGAGKSDGRLFELVRNELGMEKSIIHIGDNRQADLQQAAAHGLQTHYYPNCNETGRQYRTEEMSLICGSIYRGLVNAHIRNGLTTYSREYELGFVYGGLFVMGYCRFIHDYAEAHHIDKLLFLSRDGEILHKAYQRLYPPGQEAGNLKSENPGTEYVYWSRLAAAKLSSNYYRHDFFRRFLDHKVNQCYTLEEIFESMELEQLLDSFLQSGEGKWDRRESLNDKNAEAIRRYLIKEWEHVQNHYEKEREAAGTYYKRVLHQCKKAAVIDVGWAGSGALALSRLIAQEWKLDCKIIGIVAGTNTVHNAEPDMSDSFLFTEKLVSYLYSSAQNRDLWKWHDPAKGHNLGVELLLSSQSGSFTGFEFGNNGEVRFRFKEPDVNPEAAGEIQKGILSFLAVAAPAWQIWKNSGSLHGADAYAPIRFLMDKNQNLIQYAKENIAVQL